MRQNIFFIILLFSYVQVTYSQTGFEDSEGKTSLIISQGGAGKINITDNSIRLGYVYQRSAPSQIRFGTEVFGKAVEGVSTLFAGGKFQPETGLKFSLGWDLTRMPIEELKINPRAAFETTFRWITFAVDYKRKQFNLFQPDAAMTEQLNKKTYDGLSFVLFFNSLVGGGDNLVGLALGAERQNNLSSLTEVEIVDQITVYTNTDTLRTVKQMNKAYIGDYQEKWAFIFNCDYIWIPSLLSNRIGFDFFARLDFGKEKSDIFKPGIGIFITEKEAPTRVLGGISFEWTGLDINKFRMGLLVGFKF